MKLRYNNADSVVEENSEENKRKKRFPKLEVLVEKSREIAKKVGVGMCILVGATVIFTACGNPKDKPEQDTQNDSIEDVSDADEESDVPDDILDGFEVEDTEDVDADVEEEIEPVCPTSSEHTTPDLNDMFETETLAETSTGGGEVTFSTQLNMSMGFTAEECPLEGGFKISCVGDTESIDGQYYLKAGETTWDATVDAASSHEGVCSPLTETYPLLTYAGFEGVSVKNVSYVFTGGTEIESRGEFWVNELSALHFMVDGAREDVSTLSFTPTASGTYAISFNRGSENILLNAMAIDGIGGERTDALNASLVPGGSKFLYLAAVNSDDSIHYMMEGIPSPGYGEDLSQVICTRLSGGTGTDRLTVSLDTLEGASTFNIICPIPNDDCGCIGEGVTLSLSDISVIVSGLAGGDITAVPTLLTATIGSTSDIPEIQVDYTHTGSDPLGLPVTVSTWVTLNADGTHICSGAAPFHEEVRFRIQARDPVAGDYPSDCAGSYGG